MKNRLKFGYGLGLSQRIYIGDNRVFNYRGGISISPDFKIEKMINKKISINTELGCNYNFVQSFFTSLDKNEMKVNRISPRFLVELKIKLK